MTVSESKTVRDLALEIPNATRVFERLGIDYCCGGQRSLREACKLAKLPVEEVISNLEAAGSQVPQAAAGRVWQAAPLGELVEHILTTHHEYVKQELPRIEQLLTKVCGVHGEHHPELHRVRSSFGELAQELLSHMMKEEQILFPYIVQSSKGLASESCFGTVQSPIRMMMLEHDHAGTVLRDIRDTTHNFETPVDACTSFQALYKALEAFEADLHQHIHLENNILFPRTIALEEAA